MMFPGFIGQSSEGYSLNASTQRSINIFPEAVEVSGEPHHHILLGSPGLMNFGTLGSTSAAVRALFFEPTAQRLFAVCSTDFFEITSGGTVTDRGNVTSTTNPAYIESNGIDLLIVNGDGNVYRFVLATNTFSGPIAGLDLADVSFTDGYFIGATRNTQEFRISGLYDAGTWDALEFASAEAAPDDIIRGIASHREFWAFGSETIQVFTNTGNLDFPYEPIAGAFIEEGLLAAASVARLDNSLFFVAGDKRGGPTIRRTQGFDSPRRISTHAVEHTLRNATNVFSDAIGFGFIDRGHTFYQVYFPTAAQTWRYDVATGLWHEAAEWVAGAFVPHGSRVHAYAFNKHIVGARDTNRLYEMSLSMFKDRDGKGIRSIRRAPHLSNENRRIFYNLFELAFEAGVGNADAPHPEVNLRWSDDGGHTFSSYLPRSMGQAGAYTERARWTQLGSGRDRVFEVMCDASVKKVFTNAYLDFQSGNH